MEGGERRGGGGNIVQCTHRTTRSFSSSSFTRRRKKRRKKKKHLRESAFFSSPSSPPPPSHGQSEHKSVQVMEEGEGEILVSMPISPSGGCGVTPIIIHLEPIGVRGGGGGKRRKREEEFHGKKYTHKNTNGIKKMPNKCRGW